MAELNLNWFEPRAVLVPKFQSLSEYPAVTRDFNFIVGEPVMWADLESQVIGAAGPELESVRYRETFRDPQRDGPGRKRLLLTVQWRSHRGTLTGEQVDAAAKRIVQSCGEHLNAQLVG